jgi:hypothetical protein
MIIAGPMTPANVPWPYGTYVSAKVVVDRKQHADADGKISVEESWEFKAEDDSSVEVQITYVRGTLVPTKAETKVYSATGSYRICRVEQIEDVARSTAAGIDRVGKFS